jgi:hypothetical protein
MEKNYTGAGKFVVKPPMPLLHVLRVNGCDAAIALEVPNVIRQNATAPRLTMF